MEKVVVHVLDCAPLSGHEDACRDVVAPMYARRSEVGPARVRLEALGGGLLARDVLGVVADADVSYGEYGKPYVAGGPEFNLTNDVGMVALAVAARPVGIDLEEVPTRYRDVEDLITRKYYDEAERAAVGDLAQQRADQRGLACAVLADEHGQLAAVDVHGHILQKGLAAAHNADVFQRDAAQGARIGHEAVLLLYQGIFRQI